MSLTYVNITPQLQQHGAARNTLKSTGLARLSLAYFTRMHDLRFAQVEPMSMRRPSETTLRSNSSHRKNAPEVKCEDARELPEVSLQNRSPAQRSPRTVRFSDAEWQKIEQAAARCNLLPADFVRSASLAGTADPDGMASGALPPGIGELIKRIYGSTYMLSTVKRDEMIHEGRSEKLERTIQAARDAQAFLLDDTRNGSCAAFPCVDDGRRWRTRGPV